MGVDVQPELVDTRVRAHVEHARDYTTLADTLGIRPGDGPNGENLVAITQPTLGLQNLSGCN
ncbi:MAG: hypothetical protein JO168_22470 [Solirubrobacterales bacterium]|nr:hypothetical protein [Solirubrobacterales bacterium]